MALPLLLLVLFFVNLLVPSSISAECGVLESAGLSQARCRLDSGRTVSTYSACSNNPYSGECCEARTECSNYVAPVIEPPTSVPTPNSCPDTGYCTDGATCFSGYKLEPYAGGCLPGQKHGCCPSGTTPADASPDICQFGGVCFDKPLSGGFNCSHLGPGYRIANTSECSTMFACCKVVDGKINDRDEDDSSETEVGPYPICAQIPQTNSTAIASCNDCLDSNGLWTAIGCFDFTSQALATPRGIIGKIMQIGLSLAGGIALLMILVAAFTYATSQGEPKRTGEAKEMMTSAIIGLIFIIFSVTILQFIGVEILHLPEFGVDITP